MQLVNGLSIKVTEFNLVRHFKGKWYICLCESTSTNDLMVINQVYIALYDSRKIWSREKVEFLSETDKVKNPNVKQELRFMSLNQLKNNGVSKQDIICMMENELFDYLSITEIDEISTLTLKL